MLSKFGCSELACYGNKHLIRPRNGVGLLRCSVEDLFVGN